MDYGFGSSDDYSINIKPTDKQVKVINKHFQKAIKEPQEYVIYAMNECNIKQWYILIRNVSGKHDEFRGGEYLFELNIGKDYPYKPPRFYARTPNGLYQADKICCISIGEFHTSNYSPTLGVGVFAEQLCNGFMMADELEGKGINLVKTSPDEKRKYAKESVEYNDKYYPDIMKMLQNHYSEYSKEWTGKIPKESKPKYNFRSIVIE